MRYAMLSFAFAEHAYINLLARRTSCMRGMHVPQVADGARGNVCSLDAAQRRQIPACVELGRSDRYR